MNTDNYANNSDDINNYQIIMQITEMTLSTDNYANNRDDIKHR